MGKKGKYRSTLNCEREAGSRDSSDQIEKKEEAGLRSCDDNNRLFPESVLSEKVAKSIFFTRSFFP